MDYWRIIFGEIHPWNLAVATSNQSCPEFPVSLDFEHPFALDTASVLGNLALFVFTHTLWLFISVYSFVIVVRHIFSELEQDDSMPPESSLVLCNFHHF